MKCPECKQRMSYNREVKDYYCDSCKSSLGELEVPKITEEDSISMPKSDQVPVSEIGTLKGILFMMFGGLVLIIGPMVCLELYIIGFFLLIMGFFLVYKDRNNFTNEHKTNIKFAAILILIWIILSIILVLILPYIVQNNFLNEINDLKDEEFISKDTIVNYMENLNYIILLTPLIVACLTICRFLTIKELIQPRFIPILVIIVPMLVLSACLSMYINLETTSQLPEVLKDTTKKEFLNESKNPYSEIKQNEILVYSTSFLSITSEAIMLLCFYWTYTYQRMKKAGGVP